MRVLIVGNVGFSHVGDSFLHAAHTNGIEASILDIRQASVGPKWLRTICWRFLGRRHYRQIEFNRSLHATIRRDRPDIMLVTGIAPVTIETLEVAKMNGVTSVNYSTDDPWNPAHRTNRFLLTIPHYDITFSTRRANLGDFSHAGAKRVYYLPFGYDPRFLNIEPPSSRKSDIDVLFVGGADQDRIPIVLALIRAGLQVRLFGRYWDRQPETRDSAGGIVSPEEISRVTCSSKTVLILVRRANRDGHVMRTFEAGASRACLLVEDTAEHREIFGNDDVCVVYFDSVERMIASAKELVADPARRDRLAEACYQRIRGGQHTYADRLRTILSEASMHLENQGG